MHIDRPPAGRAAAIEPGSDLAGPRVLVVDDSAAQRKLLASVLQRAGYEVETVADAEAALVSLDRTDPTVVVCDWMMPGLSGPDFCARVRRMQREDYIYILILTSLSDKASTAHALDAGADDFLTKPVNTHELRARVRAGARVVEMQAQVLRQNHMLTDALDEIRDLYSAIDRDLGQASQLQRALLPEADCNFGPVRAGFLLRSSGRVGGDLVGHFVAGSGRLGFYSIDVSGHGVTSALLTARLAGMFSGSAPDQNVALTRSNSGTLIARDPAEIAAEINRRLLSEIETELYLTLCVVILDPASGTVELVQAGHPHPLLRTGSGQVRPIGHGGMPVGLLPDAGYDTIALRLKPGERLFLQSDGFVECPDLTGEMLGDEALAAMLRDLPDGPPSQGLNLMLEKLIEFAGIDEFPDDVSGVLIDYLGPGSDRRTQDRRGAA